MKRLHYIWAVLWAGVLLYPASYCALSVRGGYVTNGPLFMQGGAYFTWQGRYAWAPHGFVDNNTWNRVLPVIYFPLWLADTKLWHCG